MATAIPINRAGIQSTGEPLPTGGPIYWSTAAILPAGVLQTPWLDVGAWGNIKLQMYVGVGGGTLVVQWSMNPGTVHFTTAPPLLPVVAAVPYDSGAIVPLAQWMRIRYTDGGVGTPAPVVAVLVTGGIGGGGGVPVMDITPSAPVHGVTVAVNTDNSTLIATVQVGYRYRVTPIGTEGVVITNTATAAARATDEPVWPMQKIEILAIATTIRAQKLVAGSANGSVNVCPLDGGTIA